LGDADVTVSEAWGSRPINLWIQAVVCAIAAGIAAVEPERLVAKSGVDPAFGEEFVQADSEVKKGVAPA